MTKQFANPAEIAAICKALEGYCEKSGEFCVYKDGMTDDTLVDRIIMPALSYGADMSGRRQAILTRTRYMRRQLFGNVRSPTPPAVESGPLMRRLEEINNKLDRLLSNLGVA